MTDTIEEKLIEFVGRKMAEMDGTDYDGDSAAVDYDGNYVANADFTTSNSIYYDTEAEPIVDAIVSYLREQRLLMEWRPIEEAPKDGTWALCLHWSGHIDIMQYATVDNFWRSHISQDPLKRESVPTHWMPLPKPPTNKE